MRLCEGNQMSNRPGDHIAVSLEIAFAPAVGSENTCMNPCDRRFSARIAMVLVLRRFI